MSIAAKERFDLRLDAEIRHIIERAATLSGGLGTTAFIITAAVEKAKRIIAEERIIQLDRIASERFQDIMDASYRPDGEMARFLRSSRGRLPRLRK